jgi:HEPN domain-containing protein
MELIRLAAEREIGFSAAHSKLAEVLEKVLKAELLRMGWTLEKTHDLDRLLEALEGKGSDLVPQVQPLCDVLAEVYFTDRYPGFDFDDPDWLGLRTQIGQIEALLATVKGRVPTT